MKLKDIDTINGRWHALVLRLASLFLGVWPAFTLCLCLGSPVAAAEIPGTIKVDVQQGLLTVDIRNASLAEVLRVIGDRAEIQVIIKGDVSTPAAATFTDVPLDEGVRRLARGYSVVLLYAPAPDDTQRPVLTGVQLYGRGLARVGATPLRAAAPGGPSRASGVGSAGSTAPTGAHASQAPRAAGSAEWISRALTAPDPSARLQALAVPVRSGDDTMVTTLAQVLAGDSDPNVRAYAARRLGEAPGLQAAAALADALNDEDPSVRLQAVQAYAKVERGAPTAQTLGSLLAQDPDPAVRLQAVRTLDATHTEWARAALVKAKAALDLDSDRWVRDAMTSALANWTKPRTASK